MKSRYKIDFHTFKIYTAATMLRSWHFFILVLMLMMRDNFLKYMYVNTRGAGVPYPSGAPEG